MTKTSPAPAQRLGVALLRVSTDRQFQEGESIENQRRKTEFVAGRERIDIVRFFTEHYSGCKTDRRVIDDLFAFLTDNADVRFAIIGDIDRFTRGGSEVYLKLKRRLRELNVALVDATGVIQPERNRLEHLGVEYDWSVDSPSRYAEVFMAEKANSERSDILTRTIGQQIQLTRDGYQCRSAPFGYRNIKITTVDGKKKTTLSPHEIEGPWIVRMFELKADGGWANDAICEHINAMGYGSRPQNIYDKETRRVLGQTRPKLLSEKQLNRYIEKPIYCGVRAERWNGDRPVIAPIEPLVSIDLFNRANRGKVRIDQGEDGSISLHYGRQSYVDRKTSPEFLLRHVIHCPECGKPFTASKSRGRHGGLFGYYHCARGHKRVAFNKAEFEETVGKYLDSLQFKPGFLPLFREVVRDVWIQKLRDAEADTEAIRSHIYTLKERQAAMLDRITACRSVLVQEKLEAQIEELDETIRSAEKSLHRQTVKEDDIEAYFAFARKTMEPPREAIFCAGAKPKLEKLWGFIFRQPPTYAQLVDGTPELTLIYRLNRDIGPDQNQLAGVEGFEPPNGGTKIRCLTTWRYPIADKS